MHFLLLGSFAWRFDKFYAAFPYRLFKLIDKGITEAEQCHWRKVLDINILCCHDAAPRAIAGAVESLDQLLGALGKALVETFVDFIRLGIAYVERVHVLDKLGCFLARSRQ